MKRKMSLSPNAVYVQKRTGIKVWICSLPRWRNVLYEVMEGSHKGERVEVTKEKFLQDFVKAEVK